MNRFLSTLLFLKLVFFFSGLQQRTEGESLHPFFLLYSWDFGKYAIFSLLFKQRQKHGNVLVYLSLCICAYCHIMNTQMTVRLKKKKQQKIQKWVFSPTVASLFDTARLKMVVFTLTGCMHLHADTWDVNMLLLHSFPRFFPMTRFSLTASYVALTGWKALARVKEVRRKASYA